MAPWAVLGWGARGMGEALMRWDEHRWTGCPGPGALRPPAWVLLHPSRRPRRYLWLAVNKLPMKES